MNKEQDHFRFFLIFQDCNTCKCIDANSGWACTRKLCVPLDPPRKRDKRHSDRKYSGRFTAEQVIQDDFECEKNTKVKVDCNECECGPDGKIRWCTKKGCDRPLVKPENLQRKERAAEESQGAEHHYKVKFTEEETRQENFRCNANTTLDVDCNRCGCASDGKSLSWCTKKGCAVQNQQYLNNPGTKSKRDIKAAEDRLNRKGSILHPYTEAETKQPNFKCEPDSSLKVDCKRCMCGKISDI